MTWSLTDAPEIGFGNGRILGMLIAGLVGLAVFPFIEPDGWNCRQLPHRPGGRRRGRAARLDDRGAHGRRSAPLAAQEVDVGAKRGRHKTCLA